MTDDGEGRPEASDRTSDHEERAEYDRGTDAQSDPLAWSDTDDADASDDDPDSRADRSTPPDRDDRDVDRVADLETQPDADAPEAGGTPDDAPLADLAASVEDRPAPGERSPADGPFEEQDVTAIDTEVVWDRLEGEASGSDHDAGEREVRDIDAADYCKRCPYFSSPPEVRCTNQGTEILEVLDTERFRVVDCPKVRETERLERL